MVEDAVGVEDPAATVNAAGVEAAAALLTPCMVVVVAVRGMYRTLVSLLP
jgi:hypothetical protein